MKTIDLIEETATQFTAGQLPGDAIAVLERSEKFEVKFIHVGSAFVPQIRARGWVGHIPISKEVLIRVTPKISIDNIFRMLEVAYHLKSFQFLEGQTNVEHLNDVIERLAAVLARRVIDRCREGLFRAYTDQDEDLLCVRGRINLHATIKNRLRGSPNIRCDFQENTADISDNQILFWTLNVVSHMGLRRNEVQSDVRKAYRALSGAISLVNCDKLSCINRLYHRLNEDYKPMHGLCRLFLEHSGPGIRAGDRNFIPFTLRMPELFESFIAEWLKAQKLPTRVSSHYRARITGNQNLVVDIDLLLRDLATDKPLAVLDTKYKITDDFSEGDINQVVAYAARIGTNLAVLVYPRSHEPLELHYGPITVRSLGFDLSSSIEDAGYAFRDQLLSLLA
jgi:5-methylcytosine-specific restriction enzyme subunit McrC